MTDHMLLRKRLRRLQLWVATSLAAACAAMMGAAYVWVKVKSDTATISAPVGRFDQEDRPLLELLGPGRSAIRLAFGREGPTVSLVSTSGHELLRIETLGDTPRLSMTNRSGDTAVVLEVGDEGAAVDLRSGPHVPRLSLRASIDGAWAYFWDGARDLRVIAGTSASGAASVALARGGMERVELSCNPEGAQVSIRTPDGETVWEQRSDN